MKTLIKIFTIVYSIFALGCSSKPGIKQPLIAKDTTNENERKNYLFVFVGEKIDITPIPYEQGDFDNGVKAKYKILQRVYGNYNKDVIEFEAYDHFGRFWFSKNKIALLYVIEDSMKYYHEKYMYNDVYKTKNGRWAGPYTDDYKHSYNKNTIVKPEPIDFIEEVSYPIKIKDADERDIEFSYPAPYFNIVGDKAIVIYGNYIEDLFRLKKEGILTARQLFGDRQPEIKEIKLMEIKDSTKSE